MKLTYKEIPKEFLKDLPRGVAHIRQNGKEYLVVEQLFCPAGHSLMVDNVRLHGRPSIKLGLRFNEAAGFIFVDSFWGSHDKLYSFIPTPKDLAGADEDVYCPVCRCSLLVDHIKCDECGMSKFIEMLLPGGQNRILVCSKLGCPEHELVAQDISPEITEVVSDINFFGI